MNQDEREVLAGLLAAEVRTRFDGNKKAAYTAVGINPATFDRALKALPIRDDRAVAIINALWPEARGELARVPYEDESRFDDPDVPMLDGDFEDWVRTTEVLSDFQRRAVLRAMDVARRNPGRGIVVRDVSDPVDRTDLATAAHEDGDIAGEQESRHET